MWVMDGGEPRPARTLDLGAGGISITCDYRLDIGVSGQVVWEMLVNGKPQVMVVRSKVTNCILSNNQFKIGLAFSSPDNEMQNAINKFMR